MAKQLIEGVAVTVNGDLQAAIEEADASYYKRYNKEPTHVSLPVDADPDKLQIWPLVLAPPYGVGVVIVGKLQNDNARQMELFK